MKHIVVVVTLLALFSLASAFTASGIGNIYFFFYVIIFLVFFLL